MGAGNANGDASRGPVEDLARRSIWNEGGFFVVDFEWVRGLHPSDGVSHTQLPAFVLFREGASVSTVGGRVGVGDPNHVLFYNGREEYRLSYANSVRTSGTSFRIRPDALAELLREMAPDRVVERPFRVASRPALPLEYLLAQSLVAHLAEPLPKDRLFVEEVLMTLTRAIVAHGIGREPTPLRDLRSDRLRTRIPRLVSHLNAEASHDLKFVDLVVFMRCSPWYLSRVFTEEVGMPIYRYVRRLRIRGALDRILDGATSLTDVALDAGFASHSNFTRAFHEEFGVAPSRVRDRAAMTRIREVVSRLDEPTSKLPRTRAKPPRESR